MNFLKFLCTQALHVLYCMLGRRPVFLPDEIHQLYKSEGGDIVIWVEEEDDEDSSLTHKVFFQQLSEGVVLRYSRQEHGGKVSEVISCRAPGREDTILKMTDGEHDYTSYSSRNKYPAPDDEYRTHARALLKTVRAGIEDWLENV